MKGQDYAEEEEYENDAYGNEEDNSNVIEEPFKEIPRFDPAKKSHKEYEVKYKPQNRNDKDSNADKSQVKSDEKLYFFDKSLKDKLTNNSDFSLLNLFGQTQTQTQTQVNIPEPRKKEAKENLFYNVDKHKHFDLYDKHMDYHQPIRNFNEKVASNPSNSTSKSWWENPLFFSSLDDTRLKEGVEFFKYADQVNIEQFKKKRNEIKKIIKSKIKNNLLKKKQTFPSVRLAPKSRIYAMKMRFHKKFRLPHKK